MKIDSIGKTAFDVLYDTHVSSVYQTARYYTGNTHTAEEITQNVFLKLYKYMEHVNMDAIGKWLAVTTRNMALNHIRKEKREVLFADLYEEEFEELAAESTEEEFIEKWTEKGHCELIDDIFEQLYMTNERWYDAVTITYCLKKPQREVAEIMGVSIQTLHSMLHRARAWIKKNYEQRYDQINKA